VVDGDTFWIAGIDRRIRVWGLDAPEQGRPGGPRRQPRSPG
jgi:endonuclease YncB( thermonuclease family)